MIKLRFPFRVQGSLTQQGGALVERVSLDVFVRYSAFLESYPAFLGEWAELLGERGCEYQGRSKRAGCDITQPPYKTSSQSA